MDVAATDSAMQTAEPFEAPHCGAIVRFTLPPGAKR